MDKIDRTAAFKRNNEVENILRLLDSQISPVEDRLTKDSDSSDFPTIFIFGCARSGTTLLHQHLIKNINCIYPSNFISRFYYAPYVGGLYYKMFTELDKRGELLGALLSKSQDFFSSDLGKTKGITSPNEFWYFWRKHFPVNKRGTINVDDIDIKEASKFRNSIFALQNLFGGPFITKGMIANNCIDLLENIFPKAIFIHIKRGLFANAKSLYQARLDFFNDPGEWYSFYPDSPKVYHGMKPEKQIVRQIIDTNREIEESLSKCNQDRVIRIRYESFCLNSKKILDDIKDFDRNIQLNENTVSSQFAIRENKGLDRKIEASIKYEIDQL